MPKIYLIRHGQNEDNVAHILNGRRDLPLTELGREQARAAAEKLATVGLQAIYSSPLKRAKETAEIISQQTGVSPVRVKGDLREREFGVLTGQALIDIPRDIGRLISPDGTTYFLDGQGVESFPDALARAQKVLAEILAEGVDSLAIVCHGDIGKMIMAAFYDWNWQRALAEPYLANGQVIELVK